RFPDLQTTFYDNGTVDTEGNGRHGGSHEVEARSERWRRGRRRRGRSGGAADGVGARRGGAVDGVGEVEGRDGPRRRLGGEARWTASAWSGGEAWWMASTWSEWRRGGEAMDSAVSLSPPPFFFPSPSYL
uniref:Uncharacterized protein n=1 Tax=Oryza glaberrima TaxID=4538 RepID=I1QS27_ORYGL